MLRKGDWMDIKAEVEKGVYQKEIAAELGVHPRTIRWAVRRGAPARMGSQTLFYTSFYTSGCPTHGVRIGNQVRNAANTRKGSL